VLALSAHVVAVAQAARECRSHRIACAWRMMLVMRMMAARIRDDIQKSIDRYK
jgi:hypothetical protein